MYNWYAVAGIYNSASLNNPSLRKQLAPIGWHIPSDSEWTTLISFLGGQNIAGGKMKATCTTLWNPPNYSATNSSGFTGLPGGALNVPNFQSMGERGYWWSSNQTSASEGNYCIVGYEYAASYFSYQPKREGISVRCIKD